MKSNIITFPTHYASCMETLVSLLLLRDCGDRFLLAKNYCIEIHPISKELWIGEASPPLSKWCAKELDKAKMPKFSCETILLGTQRIYQRNLSTDIQLFKRMIAFLSRKNAFSKGKGVAKMALKTLYFGLWLFHEIKTEIYEGLLVLTRI